MAAPSVHRRRGRKILVLENAATLIDEDATHIGLGAEDKVCNRVKSASWLRMTGDREVETRAAAGASIRGDLGALQLVEVVSKSYRLATLKHPSSQMSLLICQRPIR